MATNGVPRPPIGVIARSPKAVFYVYRLAKSGPLGQMKTAPKPPNTDQQNSKHTLDKIAEHPYIYRVSLVLIRAI